MDHSMHHMNMDMDHGHDHGDMDMGQCSMNMLFTWSTKNLCIVFPQWRVTGTLSLLASLLLIVLLTAGYEGVRQLTRRFEVAHAKRLSAYTTPAVGGSEVHADSAPANDPPTQTLPVPIAGSQLVVGRDSRKSVEQRGKITMAALYAVQVFYSFFIMLLFMTYNGLVMLAVAVGAFVGYLAFGDDTSASKTVACH
ncbi:low-affinity Cu transporter [Aspergillus homomorphus CBS 101889]|uniref:Copper transport protein n=1 Tax=Aspergillus homomorphus (strain CBS 101889) TaxID=1450537 RepID=A0A395HWM3_ASPHC|nr:Ctr copper transporter [Aspergillus homomorphus CBS 101889]RAL12312.1 Ctr copper transporter [Aspergillus homomorphus CBS 101889]